MDKRLAIVTMLILPKTACRFNAIPIKIAKIFFGKMEKKIFKFIWNCKKIGQPK